MRDNVEKMLDRGERVVELADKSDSLNNQADSFLQVGPLGAYWYSIIIGCINICYLLALCVNDQPNQIIINNNEIPIYKL